MIENLKVKPIDAVAAVIGCLTVAVVALSAPVPIRAALTFGFCGICPGLVAVSTFAPRDRLERIVLAIGLSLALDTIVSELLAIRHEFTALTTLTVLTVLIIGKLLFAAFDLVKRLRRWSATISALGISERVQRLAGRSSRTSDAGQGC